MRWLLLALAACTPATTPAVVEVSAAHPQNVAPLGPMEPLTQSGVVPAAVKVPFEAGQLWSGTYLCAQGDTDLELRITEVKDGKVRAIFEFDHYRSGAYGSYRVEGNFDLKSSRITLRPGEWIEHPSGYSAVGMTGTVKGDAFSGRIDEDTCGDFTLRLQSNDYDEYDD